MKTNVIFFLGRFALILLLFTSCKDNENKYAFEGNFSGYAQKGPYIIGSNVSVSELNTDLSPTGNVFFSTITSDDGYFEVPNISLVSNYVEIKVEGKYFNEAHNQVSENILTLYSIIDITQQQSSNVNIFTHFASERIRQLVIEGKTFSEAQVQASEELLILFNTITLDFNDFGQLSISRDGSGNYTLLIVSSAFAKMVNEYDSEMYAKWLEMLTLFRVDFGEDGIIDNQAYIDILFTVISSIDYQQIVTNVKNRYPAVTWLSGIDANIIARAISGGILHTNYVKEILPITQNGYINLLSLDNPVLDPTENYAVIINIPNVSLTQYHTGLNIMSDPSVFDASSTYWDNQIDYLESGNFLLNFSSNQTSNIVIPVTLSGSGTAEYNFSFDSGLINYEKQMSLTW